ncbi:MAG TPA: hypothetical protein DIW47_07165 [Bacteroidetes bacterium]|nr:hypothetical protein [Bacteroidota bacterium]
MKSVLTYLAIMFFASSLKAQKLDTIYSFNHNIFFNEAPVEANGMKILFFSSTHCILAVKHVSGIPDSLYMIAVCDYQKHGDTLVLHSYNDSAILDPRYFEVDAKMNIENIIYRIFGDKTFYSRDFWVNYGFDSLVLLLILKEDEVRFISCQR